MNDPYLQAAMRRQRFYVRLAYVYFYVGLPLCYLLAVGLGWDMASAVVYAGVFWVGAVCIAGFGAWPFVQAYSWWHRHRHIKASGEWVLGRENRRVTRV